MVPSPIPALEPLPVVLVLYEKTATSTAALDLSGKGLEIREQALETDYRQVVDAVDIVLLDVARPLKAIDICRSIREVSAVPLLLVTAPATEASVVVALELGADDYIVRPYPPNVLMARIRSVLRRVSQSRPRVVNPDGVLVVGQIQLDPPSHDVYVRGQRRAFPMKEFALLQLLMLNAGRPLSRRLLLDRVWGPNHVDATGTLDVHIGRIRSRIELDPAHPRLLLTVRGVGFKLQDRVDG
jgi:two-component system response regulator RegX3